MNKAEYAKEVGMVSAIISDTILKKLYAETESYLETSEMIADWAVEFVEKHKNTNWEDYTCGEKQMPALSEEFNKKQKLTSIKDGKKTKKPMEIICWDDAVIDFAHYKFEQYEN